MKNKQSAGIMAIFLGGLGLHKFYLNKTAAGIIYLLFCWTLIPACIGFIEGIIYLAMSEEKFDKKYNKNFVKTDNVAQNNTSNFVKPKNIVINNIASGSTGPNNENKINNVPKNKVPTQSVSNNDTTQNNNIQNNTVHNSNNSGKDKNNKNAIIGGIIIVTIIAMAIYCVSGFVGGKENTGITIDSYIENLNNIGISINERIGEPQQLDEGGYYYLYEHSSETEVVIYTDNDKYITSVIVNSKYIYGVGIVSDINCSLASKFIAAATGKSEDAYYSIIKSCVNGGSETTLEDSGYLFTYTNTLMKYYQSIAFQIKK